MTPHFPSPRPDQFGDSPQMPSPLRSILNNYVGPYFVRSFLARGGSAYVLDVTDCNGQPWALKIAAPTQATPQIPNYLRLDYATSARHPLAISNDEIVATAFQRASDGRYLPATLSDAQIDNKIKEEHALLSLAKGVGGVPKVDPILYFHHGRPAFVMERIEGVTLREKMRAGHPISFKHFQKIAELSLQLAAKTGNLGHGDLKPENILIDLNGNVRLIDPVITATRDALLIASAPYNPLLLSAPRCDIFAIGTILYEEITKTLPWSELSPFRGAGLSSPSDIDSLWLAYSLSYPPPTMRNKNCPLWLEQIIKNCIFKDNYSYLDIFRER